MGQAATSFYKRLASHLSEKRHQDYWDGYEQFWVLPFFDPLLCVYVGTEPDVHHMFLMMLLLTSLLARATLSINIEFLYTPNTALSSTLNFFLSEL